jgi:hypothetical protein
MPAAYPFPSGVLPAAGGYPASGSFNRLTLGRSGRPEREDGGGRPEHTGVEHPFVAGGPGTLCPSGPPPGACPGLPTFRPDDRARRPPWDST